MRPYQGLVGIALLVGWLGVGTGTASAAWNNVFQVCCHGCRSESSSSFFAPPPPTNSCAKISYVQRCYYQPVTTYKMETRYEAVTSYRTSYYLEPCTSYRYVSYYDPCSCSCKQTVQTVTSYRVRSKCNPVVNYVQRCSMVPVTSYRQSFYMEPVVTYSAPACCPTACPEPCDNCNNAAAQQPRSSPPPAADLSEIPGGARGNAATDNSNGLLPPQTLPQSGSSYPKFPQTAPPPLAPPPAAPRMDRTASFQPSRLQGQVVHDDRFTPRSDAKLVFVNASKSNDRQIAGVDSLGRFTIALPEGDWWIYVAASGNKPTYHSTIHMAASGERLVTVVSR